MIKRVIWFFRLVWRPIHGEPDGTVIRMNIACAWDIARDFAENPKIKAFEWK